MLKKKELYWLFALTKGYRKTILLPLLFSILSIVLSLAFVELMRIIVDNITNQDCNLIVLILLLCSCKLLQFTFEEGETYYREKTNAVLEYSYSLRIFSKLFSSRSRDVRAMHSGDEMSRLTTDVGIVTQCVSYTLPIIIYAFAQLILTSVYLLSVKPLLTLILICIMPLMLLIARYYTRKLLPVSREIRETDARANQYMQEHLQKHEILASLGVTRYVINSVRTLQHALYCVIKKRIKYDVAAQAFIDLGFTISYIAVICWGLAGIRDGIFTYALLLVFMQLVGQIERPFVLLKTQYPVLINSFASAQRLIEMEEMPSEDAEAQKMLHGTAGIIFHNVSFAYKKDKQIYKDFSYTFPPNSVTAIIGETGAGKTTLFQLIMSHLHPSHGAIYFYTTAGEKIEASPLTRCNCTYVPQGNSLISGTIRYNLSLGNLDASEQEMRAALHTAAADFVLEELPDGIDTRIGENGLGLSEGQAQRIAIARGLLHKSSIMLLDEPTSALDPRTEELLLSRLTNTCTDKTILIISHEKEIHKFVNHTLRIS